MPNWLNPNVCIPVAVILLFIVGVIYGISPQGRKQHELDEQRARARDAELDKIYGRPDWL